MIPDNAIQIRGVREIQAALRQLDGESQKLIKLAFDDVAQILVRDIKANMRNGPAVRGHLQDSVKSTSQQREGRIRSGDKSGKKFPYAGWLDFGGQRPRDKNPTSNRRKFIDRGRYVYPSLDSHYDEVYTAMHDALIEILESVDWRAGG